MQEAYWEDFLPVALNCGMTAEEFWKGDPRLVKSYIIKHKIEMNEYNYKSWLSNFYTCNAVNVGVSRIFSSNTNITYLKEPIKEFNIDFDEDKVVLTKENMSNEHRKRTNFWAKLGKKGG